MHFCAQDEFEQRNDRKLAQLKNMVERKALADLAWDGLGIQGFLYLSYSDNLKVIF